MLPDSFLWPGRIVVHACGGSKNSLIPRARDPAISAASPGDSVMSSFPTRGTGGVATPSDNRQGVECRCVKGRRTHSGNKVPASGAGLPDVTGMILCPLRPDHTRHKRQIAESAELCSFASSSVFRRL